MSTLHQPGRAIRDRFWVAGPIGLLLAFFWQPALRLIEPFVLTSVSSLLVIALVLVERAASLARPRVSPMLYCLAVLLATLGVGEAVYFAGRALTVSDANDTRCLNIEKRMLQMGPTREGDAAVFQALGCRPQATKQIPWQQVRSTSRRPATDVI